MKNKTKIMLQILLTCLVLSCSDSNKQFKIEKPQNCIVPIEDSYIQILHVWAKDNNLDIDWNNTTELNHDYLRCNDSVNFWLNEIIYTYQKLISLIDSHSVANNYSLEFNYNVYYYRDSLINFISREDLHELNKDEVLLVTNVFYTIGNSYNDQLMEKQNLPPEYKYVSDQFKIMEKYISDITSRYNKLLLNDLKVSREDLDVFDKRAYNFKKVMYYVLVEKNKNKEIVIKVDKGKIYKVR